MLAPPLSPQPRAPLTAINIRAVSPLAGQRARLITQSIRFRHGQFRLVLEVAEFAVDAFSLVQMEVVTEVHARLPDCQSKSSAFGV